MHFCSADLEVWFLLLQLFYLISEREKILSKHHLFLIVRGRWREADHYTGLTLRSPSEISAKLFEDLHLLAYFRSKIEKVSRIEAESIAFISYL